MSAYNRIDMKNKKYNRLFVLEYSHTKGKRSFWKCLCDCGEIKLIRGTTLRNGETKSCGCWNSEVVSKRSYKHGHAPRIKRSKTYVAWYSMFCRCLYPKNKHYKNYGGRGISVCDRWKDFRNFLADMGESPKNLTLDRINNDGNYEPGNCRWTTRKENNNNRRPAKKRGGV